MERLGRPHEFAWLDQLETRHLPWPAFRRRVPPGFDPERCWHLARAARSTAAHAFPLTPPDGQPFQFSVPAELSRALHRVDKELAGRLGAAQDGLSGPVESYVVSSLREEAASTAILEGAATTRREAQELLKEGRRPRSLAERMVVGSYRAIQQARAWRERPLDLPMLLTLHAETVSGSLDDPGAEGRLRRPGERIEVVDRMTGEVPHSPPVAELLPERLQRLFAFANGDDADSGPFVHPVVRAMLVHFWLAWEHPFVDGNGRMARALFYWSMLRSGYWLAEYISISRYIVGSRGGYRDAFLDAELDNQDATHFLMYHARILGLAIEGFRVYVDRKAREQRRSLDLLERVPDLNARQLDVLRRALRVPTTRFTRASHANSQRITHMTAGADLRGLVQRGLLREIKVGRRFEYLPVADLSEQLGPLEPS